MNTHALDRDGNPIEVGDLVTCHRINNISSTFKVVDIRPYNNRHIEVGLIAINGSPYVAHYISSGAISILKDPIKFKESLPV